LFYRKPSPRSYVINNQESQIAFYGASNNYLMLIDASDGSIEKIRAPTNSFDNNYSPTLLYSEDGKL